MLIIADEHVERDLVELLRSRGHDVIWIVDDRPGATDREILQRAELESRVLITSDKGFGSLVFEEGLSARNGIILFRLRATDPPLSAEYAITVIESRAIWSGCFAVVEEGRVRVVPLPLASEP